MADTATAVPKLLYTAQDVMAATSFGSTYVYEALASGRLKSLGSGKRRRIRHEDLMAWIEAMEAT